MKKFGDYNIAPIHCETKVGGTEVKSWLYKINGILYPHKSDYVCPALLKRMKGDLRDALVGLYNTEVPYNSQKKKDEILQKGKSFYNTIRDLEVNFKWEPNDAEDIQKVLCYWVSAFVRKKPDLTTEEAIMLLKESKQAYEDYYMAASQHIKLDKVSTKSFKSVQDELTHYIQSSLGI